MSLIPSNIKGTWGNQKMAPSGRGKGKGWDGGSRCVGATTIRQLAHGPELASRTPRDDGDHSFDDLTQPLDMVPDSFLNNL